VLFILESDNCKLFLYLNPIYFFNDLINYVFKDNYIFEDLSGHF